MRTTLDIDDDVLELARGVAHYRKQSVGKVISDVFRRNLQSAENEAIRNGVRIIHRPRDAATVTLEVVNRLRDDLQ